MRSLGRFRPGDTALLRQAIGDLPRGTVLRVIGLIETSSGRTYHVQPIASAVVEQEHEQPKPIGPELTIDGTMLARSLPDFRSGITIA